MQEDINPKFKWVEAEDVDEKVNGKERDAFDREDAEEDDKREEEVRIDRTNTQFLHC